MDKRVYVLMNTLNGDSGEITRILMCKPGVIAVDALEGPPDMIMTVEAADRTELARLAVEAIASVEGIAETVQLLPARNGVSLSISSSN